MSVTKRKNVEKSSCPLISAIPCTSSLSSAARNTESLCTAIALEVVSKVPLSMMSEFSVTLQQCEIQEIKMRQSKGQYCETAMSPSQYGASISHLVQICPGSIVHQQCPLAHVQSHHLKISPQLSWWPLLPVHHLDHQLVHSRLDHDEAVTEAVAEERLTAGADAVGGDNAH